MKFFLVAGIFDKPAKAAVLNMNASNGFYGCTKCLQPGVTYKDQEKETGKSVQNTIETFYVNLFLLRAHTLTKIFSMNFLKTIMLSY